MKKLFAATALAAAMVMPVAGLPAGLPDAVAAPAQTFTPQQQAQIAKKLYLETNQVRRRAGKLPLKWNNRLARECTQWSRVQARTNTLMHDKTHRVGFYHGENVYWTSDNHPEKAVRAWAKSPGHYRNMVNSSFRQVGIGMAQDSRGGWYVTQRFLR